MIPDRKRIPSKLDPFEAELLSLNDQGKTLTQIQQWLTERGTPASISTIGSFLTKARTERARKTRPTVDYLPYLPKLQKLLDALKEKQRKRRDRIRRRNAPRKRSKSR